MDETQEQKAQAQDTPAAATPAEAAAPSGPSDSHDPRPGRKPGPDTADTYSFALIWICGNDVCKTRVVTDHAPVIRQALTRSTLIMQCPKCSMKRHVGPPVMPEPNLRERIMQKESNADRRAAARMVSRLVR